MRCDRLREAIVDHARGVRLGAGTEAAIESHLEHCSACAALLERERQLTLGLRAVAGSAADLRAPEEVERRLLAVFASCHHEPNLAARRPARMWQARPLQVAAAVVLIAGSAWGIITMKNRPATSDRLVPASDGTRKEAAPIPPERPPVAGIPMGVAGAAPSKAPSRPSAAAARNGAGARSGSSIENFVPLPAAAELPAFESGQIVRVDLPVASLPSFGVEILPEAGRTTVEADFLVGQDGHARAIRLVRTDEDSRSRQ